MSIRLYNKNRSETDETNILLCLCAMHDRTDHAHTAPTHEDVHFLWRKLVSPHRDFDYDKDHDEMAMYRRQLMERH